MSMDDDQITHPVRQVQRVGIDPRQLESYLRLVDEISKACDAPPFDVVNALREFGALVTGKSALVLNLPAEEVVEI